MNDAISSEDYIPAATRTLAPTELRIFWRCHQKIISVWKHKTSRTQLVSTFAKPPQTPTSERNVKPKPAGSSCQTGGLSHHMDVNVSSLAGLQRHAVPSQHVWTKVKGALTSLLARSYSRVGKYESHTPRLHLVIFPRLHAQWRRAGILLQRHGLNGDEDAHAMRRRWNPVGPLRGRTQSLC